MIIFPSYSLFSLISFDQNIGKGCHGGDLGSVMGLVLVLVNDTCFLINYMSVVVGVSIVIKQNVWILIVSDIYGKLSKKHT